MTNNITPKMSRLINGIHCSIRVGSDTIGHVCSISFHVKLNFITQFHPTVVVDQ